MATGANTQCKYGCVEDLNPKIPSIPPPGFMETQLHTPWLALQSIKFKQADPDSFLPQQDA